MSQSPEQQILDLIPADHPDAVEAKLILNMAFQIKSEGLSDDDEDFEYKSDVLRQAAEITASLCEIHGVNIEPPTVEKPAPNPIPSTVITVPTSQVQHIRIENVVTLQQGNTDLTSWVYWVIVPFVLGILFVAGAAMF